MKQTELVLERLKRGPITPVDAIQFGCFRLAARIKDLRDMGYSIHTESCQTDEGKRYARYTLIRQAKAA